MLRRAVVMAVTVILGLSTGVRAQQKDSELQKLFEEYQAAWNKGDAKALAALHTPEAIRIGSDAQLAIGREAIEQAFTNSFGGRFKGTKLTLQEGRTQNVTSDVRVTEGTYEVTGGTGGSLKGRYMNTVVRQQGQWKLASVAAIPQPTAK